MPLPLTRPPETEPATKTVWGSPAGKKRLAARLVKLIPPLVISESDVEWFLDAFEKVVEKAHHFPGPVWEVTTRLAKFALRR